MNQVTVAVSVESDIDTVWNAFTNAKHIMHWYFASPDWHCPSAKNDAKTGGKFRIRNEALQSLVPF